MLDSLVNLERYPLHEPEGATYRAVIADARRDLDGNSLAVFEDFLTECGLQLLLDDAAKLAPGAFTASRNDSAYGITADADLAADHPRNLRHTSRVRGAAYHRMGGTNLEALYLLPEIPRFIADVTEKRRLYLHEDPSNAVVLQVYETGDHLGWHFDKARYSNVLNLQPPDKGGLFECAPGIRDDEHENYDAVSAVFDGDSGAVHRSRPEPGTFVVFRGNHTLHRVTPVSGSTARLSLVLSYDDEPGQKLDYATRRAFFGDGVPVG